jgi:cation diffusion facilitator family transporter
MIEHAELSEKEFKIRQGAAALTFLVGVIIMTVKFWAFNMTRSQAIYSDALESIVNVVTAAVGYVVIYYASKPADTDHPYGHGKVEYFSAAFEGGLIFFAAIFVIVEAIKAQVRHQSLASIDEGLWLISACGLANLGFGFFLKWMGRKFASPTLLSAGVHLLVDFWTTLAAVVGVFAVKLTGIDGLDRITAFFLGGYMIYSGLKLVRGSVLELMDAEDIRLLEQLAVIFEANSGEGIIQIHQTKIIRSGWFHHIDGHAVVPEFWNVEQAHARLDIFEDNVIKAYPYGGEVNFHLDPCKRKYCAVCDYRDCPVRQAPFESRLPVQVEHLRSKTEPL